MDNIIPVGSVVKIGKGFLKIMICGLFPVNMKDNKCYQYLGVVYPSGVSETAQYIFFNSSDISEVLFYGYSTEESIAEINEVYMQLKQQIR